MAKGKMVIFTAPASAEKEGEFNRWYNEVHIPETPAVKSSLVYDPATKAWGPEEVTSSGGGGSGGNRVFIQSADPANVASNNVQTGDFWLEV